MKWNKNTTTVKDQWWKLVVKPWTWSHRNIFCGSMCGRYGRRDQHLWFWYGGTMVVDQVFSSTGLTHHAWQATFSRCPFSAGYIVILRSHVFFFQRMEFYIFPLLLFYPLHHPYRFSLHFFFFCSLCYFSQSLFDSLLGGIICLLVMLLLLFRFTANRKWEWEKRKKPAQE